MNEYPPERSVQAGARTRRRVGPVWWVVVFGALTTAGLGVLTMGLLVLHALGYGAVTVIAPQAQAAAPDASRYVLAFAVSVTAQVATAAAATSLAPRTVLRAWRPVALGLAASSVAAAFGSCALLLTLGVSPVALVLDL